MSVTPYSNSNDSKKNQVSAMFNNIAHKYDFLNHFLSLGIDRYWRKKAIQKLRTSQPKFILDIATGTGDLAIEALKLNPENIIGIDISEEMLAYGQKKLIGKGITSINLQKADSENLPFETNTFDAITVGFGVRNFENLELGLTEMFRVLKPNGKVIILEFSKPETFPFAQLYQWYFNKILPLIGKLFSKDNDAYDYLYKSVQAFPSKDKFIQILETIGYQNCSQKSLTIGIVSIYMAEKVNL